MNPYEMPHRILDALTYLVYRDAGKHHRPTKTIPLKKPWWKFWKPSYRLEPYELTDAHKAVSGWNFVSSYTRINPYTDLIERIDKMRVRVDIGLCNEFMFDELAVDVQYHCGTCTWADVDDFREELLK